MSELEEGIAALRIQALEEKTARMLKEFEEVDQILGKALGYPLFKDDQANFPGATGVCVGEHVTVTLAMEAAELIAKLKKRHPTTEEAVAQYHWLKANSKRNKNNDQK